MRKEIFAKIYEDGIWKSGSSKSGSGSEIEQTKILSEYLRWLIRIERIETFIDAPCGDYHWQNQFADDVKNYIGLDIVPELIEELNSRIIEVDGRETSFAVRDIVSDSLPPGDFLLCRDCLVHLSHDESLKAIRNMISAPIRLIGITTFIDRESNEDAPAPEWTPMNLSHEPFNFRAPKYL